MLFEMIPLATIPLAIAIMGILGLVGLKGWEQKRGKVVCGVVRAYIDTQVMRLGWWFAKRLPEMLKKRASACAHAVTYRVTAAVLVVVRFLERRLTRFVNFVKGRRDVRKQQRTRSPYLRDVRNYRDEIRSNGTRAPQK